MAYTWTELLDNIKVRSAMPTSQNTFTEARLLVIANDELRTTMLPFLQKVREAYYSYNDDRTISGAASYQLSTRAIGGKLEDACLINGTSRFDLARYYEDEQGDTGQPQGGTYGIILKRNDVYLLPASPSGWSTLRMSILLRPLQIVAQDSAAIVTAINTGTKTVTFTTVPSTWVNTQTFDIVQGKPHFDPIGIDLAAATVTTGASGTIVFTATLPTRLAVGDWVGLAGETPVIMLPLELHPMLAQACACQVLRSQRDLALLKEAEEKMKMMKAECLSLITPRIEQEGKKIVNRTGILRRGI